MLLEIFILVQNFIKEENEENEENEVIEFII